MTVHELSRGWRHSLDWVRANDGCRRDIPGRLAGKLDAIADRKVGVLQVNAIHQDVTFDKTMTAAVDHQIKDLAHWLGLKLMPR